MQPRVVLGVCGGIAAYKAVEICRRLVDAGIFVTPVLTDAATRFVGEVTFSALASEPVQRSLWDEESPIPHTRLGQQCTLIVVPATADFLARAAAGMADDLLTATVLATRAPVLVCPAMHTEMWEHAAVRENLSTLRRRGVHVLTPEVGHLAGGDEGAGRLAEPALVVSRALDLLGSGSTAGALRTGDLAGRSVLISAGGTREALDPVRVLTNRSSGKQGHALAAAAARRGAAVTLVTASDLAVDVAVSSVVRVEAAAEMQVALEAVADTAEVIIMAAAVSDFRPKAPATRKLATEDGVPEIILEPTPDILRGLVGARRPGQIIVGFAAETHDAIEHGTRKLAKKGVDLLVVNDVSDPGVGFDHDTNAVTILDAAGAQVIVSLRSKVAIADAVLDRVVDLFSQNDGDRGTPPARPGGRQP